jgi:hypothetical protein
MKPQENTIEHTLQSLDAIQRLEVSVGLNFAIKNNFNTSKVISMSTNQKWMLAASIVLLLGLNFITITQYSISTNSTSSKEEKNVVYQEYFNNLNE